MEIITRKSSFAPDIRAVYDNYKISHSSFFPRYNLLENQTGHYISILELFNENGPPPSRKVLWIGHLGTSDKLSIESSNQQARWLPYCSIGIGNTAVFEKAFEPNTLMHIQTPHAFFEPREGAPEHSSK